MKENLISAGLVGLVVLAIKLYFDYQKWRAKKRWERLFETMRDYHQHMMNQGMDTSELLKDMREVAGKIGRL